MAGQLTPALRNHAGRRRIGWLPYVAAMAAISLLVIALATFAVVQEKQRYRERAIVSTQNNASLLASTIRGNLERVDVSLQSVVLHIREESAKARLIEKELNAYLAARRTLQPGITNLRILDKQGFVRFGYDVQTETPVSLADRDFYLRARDEPNAGVIVSGPVFTKISKQWVIVLARRIDLADGSFAGVVYANIACESFQKVLAQPQLGEHGAATLRTLDLALVNRSPDNKGAVGSRTVSQELRDRVMANPEGGDYIAATAIDGIERSNAFRKVEGYPFYVIVGRATQDYLAEWRFNLLVLAGLAAITILTLGVAGRKVYASRVALEEANQEIWDLYGRAPCGYYSLDDEGKYLRINDTALDWIGRQREDVIGKLGPGDFFTPESRQLFEQNFPDFKRKGFIDDVEFEMANPRRNVRFVSVTANAIYDGSGQFVMSRSVMFDITPLRQAQAEALQLMREQTAMLDNDLIGIVKLSQRRAVWHNKGLERIFGYSASEFSGQSSRMLYPDEQGYQAFGAAAYPVLCAGGRYRSQVTMVRKDGERLWIDASGVLISAETGDCMWLLADITPLKHAEEARVQAAQLEAENRKLREANLLKDQFLATMSHELRTPLNSVIGLSGLLESGAIGPDSPKFAGFLHNIGVSGRQLLQLIEEVLDLAKVQSGKFDFHPEAIDLPALINESIALHHAEAERKKIGISIEIDDSLSGIEIDRLRLKQVVTHFLSNAIKFTFEGGRVTIRARHEDARRFRMEVEDTGIGIAESDLPKVFTETRQLDSDLNRRHGGTGLGLALVKRLVEAQGGMLGVRSVLGEGSVFFVVLPTAAGRAEPPGKAKGPAA